MFSNIYYPRTGNLLSRNETPRKPRSQRRSFAGSASAATFRRGLTQRDRDSKIAAAGQALAESQFGRGEMKLRQALLRAALVVAAGSLVLAGPTFGVRQAVPGTHGNLRDF